MLAELVVAPPSLVGHSVEVESLHPTAKAAAKKRTRVVMTQMVATPRANVNGERGSEWAQRCKSS